jgi:hypothetical protein
MRGRRARRSWPLIMLGTLAVVFIDASPARAQDACSLLNTCSDGVGLGGSVDTGPIDETVDRVIDVADGTVGQGDDPDPIDDAIDAVGDATGVDTTIVKDAKKKVDSTVDRILDEVPGTGGGTQPTGGGEGSPGGSEPPGSRAGRGGRPEGGAGLRPIGGTPAAPGASAKVGFEPEPSAGRVDLVSAPGSGPEHPSRRTQLAGGSPRVIPKVIRQLAFPLILGLAVAMFLGVQSRIDSTESKLVHAPRETHYLSFQ